MGSGLDAGVVYFVGGACTLFAAGYTVLARGWWRTRLGLAMGVRDIVIPVALLPQALHFALGVSLAVRWFAWYWRASMLLLGAVTLWRLWVVWRVQREARTRSEPP